MAAIAVDQPREHANRPSSLRLVAAPPSRRRPARVYRRRRLVALLVVLTVVVIIVHGATGVLGASASAGSVPSAPVVLVAEPGDTYWSLAGTIHEGGDLRSTVDALVDANGGRGLQVGDRIVLPG